MKGFSHQSTSDILQALLGPGGTILNLVELLTIFAQNEKKKKKNQSFKDLELSWLNQKQGKSIYFARFTRRMKERRVGVCAAPQSWAKSTSTYALRKNKTKNFLPR